YRTVTGVQTCALPISARGDGGGIDGEGLARGGEHDHRVGGLALEGLQQRVAVLEGERGKIDAVAAAGADPALLRQDHRDRLLERSEARRVGSEVSSRR